MTELTTDEYFELTEYLEEELAEAGFDITYVESEGTRSTRIDFCDDTSIWVNNDVIEGCVHKVVEEEMTKIILNSPRVLLNNYVRFL